MNYTVNWKEKELPLRTAAIYPSPYHKNSVMEYVSFLLKEPGILRIASRKEVRSAVVRPFSLGIVPRIENGEIVVRLEHPVKFSLEINGSAEDNLLVLAEEDRYGAFSQEGDGAVRLAGRGEIVGFPEGKEVIFVPKGKEVAAVPGRKEGGVVPEGKEAAVVPEGKEAVVVPEGKGATVIPEGKEAAFIPEGKEVDIVPEGKEAAAVPGRKEGTVVPEGEETTIVPEEKEAASLPDGGNIIYFPAGVHNADLLTVERDHTTVYLAEGAYVHGKLVLTHCSHVTVCGYGVISMERYPYEARPVYARCVDAIECRDVTLRDITILDSNDWSLRICGCEDVLVDNVKIIGCRGNSDGIDICGSRRVLVQNAFTRVWDDSLVVKALDTGDVEDVTFRRCILWNDFARPMEVGVELRANRVRRVKFQDIDVLHSPTGYPLMGIHHGDRALVSEIVFENIRIEDAPGAQLFDIRITPSYWNRDRQMGCIRDVAFRRIHVVGNPGLPLLLSDSRLQGYDETHSIRDVAFEEIDICGKTPGDAGTLGLKCMEYTEGVRVVPAPRLPQMERVDTAVEITKSFRCRPDGFYEGEITMVLRNTAPFDREKEVWLKLSPEHLGDYERCRHKVFLPAGEERRIACPAVLQPGKYVAAVQSEDPEIRYAWQMIALDWRMVQEEPAGAVYGNVQEEPVGAVYGNVQEEPVGAVYGNVQEEPARAVYRSVQKEFAETVCETGDKSVAPMCESKAQPAPVSAISSLKKDVSLRPLEFVNYWGDRLGNFLAWAEGENLVIDSSLLLRKDCTLVLYTALPVKQEPGEVLFSVEETDFGQVPAILDGRQGPEAAPQLRCPLEITLVFRNQPKVDKINTLEVRGGSDRCVRIPMKELGISEGAGHFWMEVEARLPEVEAYHYPYTLFHSVTPLTTAHMYANCSLNSLKRDSDYR